MLPVPNVDYFALDSVLSLSLSLIRGPGRAGCSGTRKQLPGCMHTKEPQNGCDTHAPGRREARKEASREDVGQHLAKRYAHGRIRHREKFNFGKDFTQKGKGRRGCEDSISEEARVELRTVSLYKYVAEKWNTLW